MMGLVCEVIEGKETLSIHILILFIIFEITRDERHIGV